MGKLKRLWNTQLYKEGLLQTKWIALILFVSGMLSIEPFTDHGVGMEIFGGFCFLCTMLMVFTLFGFLNKRAGSDYYHMLSQDRRTIYCSYSAAVLTWTGVIIIILMAAGNQKLEHEILLGLYCFVICLLTMGASALAMSLTGNRIANLLAVFAILFVPRILLNSYIDCFFELCPYVSKSSLLGTVTDSAYHAIYGMWDLLGYDIFHTAEYNVYNALNQENAYTTMKIAIIYSSVVGLGYLIIGGIFFYRRRSEVATSSSINRFFQIALRCVVTMAICTIPIAKLAEYFVKWNQEEQIFHVVLWYLFIVFIWVLIEFVTTKNGKKVRKSLVQLPLLAVFNVVVITAIVVNANAVSKRIPEVSNLTSVELITGEDDYYSVWVSAEHRYTKYIFQILEDAGCMKFESDEIKEFFVRNLKETIEWCHSKDENQTYTDDEYEEYAFEYTVRFHEVDKNITRTILLSGDEVDMVESFIDENAKKTYDYAFPMQTPERMRKEAEEQKIGELYYSDEIGHWMSEEDYAKLYSLLYEEWSALNPPLSVFTDYEYSLYDRMMVDSLRVSTGDIVYYVPITRETPKAVAYVANCANKSDKSFHFDWFVEDIDNGNRYASMNVLLCDPDKKESYEAHFELENPDRIGKPLTKDDLLKWQQIVAAHKEDGEITADQAMMKIGYYDGKSTFEDSKWINLTTEELQQAKELMGE